MKGKTSWRAWAVIKWFLPVAGMAGLLLMSRIIIVRRICAVIAFLSLIAWLIVKAEKASGLRDLFSKLAPLLPPAAYTAAGMEGMESLADFLNRVTDWAGLPVELDGQASAYILLIALYLPINWWANRDRTTLGKNRENSDPMLREKTVAEKRDAFCDDLLLRLKKINQDTDWNAGYYAPIEAEVEAGTRDHHRKRYPDLLKCMKKIRHNGKVYLVLGDPGSGKSVSLRKLCMDLLGESKDSGKIPVYINLKEWTEPWTLDNRPTPQDLVSFIRQTLRQGIDVFSDDFVDNYFEPMLKNGWWYFVFDSFDEMPCLMGRENCGELIAHISNLLSNFLTSPGQSGGIIASRLNKAPTQALGAESTLFLREFDDRRIGIMLDKYLNHGEEVAKKLFDGTREHLATLCRNPFSLTLLINYIREKGVIFPETQMDLYQNFVEERLNRCRERLEKAGLTAEDIRDAARELADLMQEEQTLEYPISRLIPTERWKTVLDILKYARICRFSEQQDAVSFVHRRFQEFLLVECILAGQREIRPEEYEGITTGAGLRDALVLYCEVAEKEKSAKIAEYCWSKVQKNIGSRTYIGNPGCLELTNTLYFMTEAFRNRPDAVENFRDEFEKMVEDNLDRKTDSMVSLAVVNSMALFDGERLQRIILRIFMMNSRWLQDAVIKNCRAVRKMNRDVEKKFIRYFEYMPPIEFLRRFRDIRFSMLYVPAFRYVRVKHLLCGIFYWSFLLLPGCLVFYFIFACFPFPLVYLPAWMNTWVESIVQIGFISWSLYNIGLSFSFDTTGEWSMVMRLLSSTSIIILGCIISAISSAFPLPIPIFSVAFGLVCMVLFLPTVTHYFLVVVRGVCRIFRFMICIWEHPREALAAWGIAGIIATMAYIHSNPLLRSDIEIHLTEPYDYIILICFIMIPVAVIFFQRFLDLYWIKHQPNINSIERTALAENLERLRTRKGRRAYAKYLLEHKMRLTGAWPNGVRPNWHMGKPLKIGFLIIQSRVLDFDDVLDHDLAKLESLELKTYRYMF